KCNRGQPPDRANEFSAADSASYLCALAKEGSPEGVIAVWSKRIRMDAFQTIFQYRARETRWPLDPVRKIKARRMQEITITVPGESLISGGSIVAMLLAREWFWAPSGSPTPPPPEGPAMEAVRSARERKFSDQLKPSPVAEAMVSRLLLNGILNEVRDRDEDAEREDLLEGSEDKPRPFPSRAEIVPVDGTDVDACRAC
ncbi:11872_t:CDS:2, partial [Scutellospora calospora]